MTIYECLGIDRILIDIEIPEEALLNNITEDLRGEAERIFTNIERIAVKCSISRAEHYLQVIEIVLNSPQDIQRISYIIQKAIKYRVLFVFLYDERYLLLWRNFYLTESTENVYTEHTTHCTNWMYGECFHEDVVYFLNIEMIENDCDENYTLSSYVKQSVYDNGDWIYFRDILNNVVHLNNCLIESDLVCSRYLIDWMQTHNRVQSRVDYQELIQTAYQREAYSIIENHLFFEKYTLQLIIMELEKSYYMRGMGYTGRRPMLYFEQISSPATFDDESNSIEKISSMLYEYDDDLVYMGNYYSENGYSFFNDTDRLLIAEIYGRSPFKHQLYNTSPRQEEYQYFKNEDLRVAEENRRAEGQLKAEQLRHAEEQRKAEQLRLAEEKRRAEEQRIREELRQAEEQRILEQLRHAEEQRKAEQLRLVEEKRRAEEQRIREELRQAEEQRILEQLRHAEEQRKAEQLRLAEEKRRAEEQRIREELRQAEEQRILEQLRLAEEQRKAEEARLAEEKRRTEEQRVREELRQAEEQRILEQLRLAEEQRKAEEARLAEEKRRTEEQRVREELRQAEEQRILEQLRHAEEQRKAEQLRLVEEKRRAEEQRIREELRQAEEQRILEQLRHAEEQRKAEQLRLAEEKRRAEEQRIREELRQAEEQRILEQLRHAEEQRKAEQLCLAEEKRRAEEQRIREELRQAEEQRILEQLRLAEEQRKAEEVRLAEEQRQAEIQRILGQLRLILEQRKAEEVRLAEEQRMIEELHRTTEKQLFEQLCRILKKRIAEETHLAEERRKAEEARLAEEQRKAEELARIRMENERKDKIYDIAVHLYESTELSVLSEAIALLRHIEGWRDSGEQILRLEEKIASVKTELRRSQYRQDGVCQYCGGKFKGIFRRTCTRCGKRKDYK